MLPVNRRELMDECTRSNPCGRLDCYECVLHGREGASRLLDRWVPVPEPAEKIDDGDGWPPSYSDMDVIFDGDEPEVPVPTVLKRVDGHALLYPGKVNVLYGDSESGKTWIALAGIAEVLCSGGRAAFVDLDHNGPREIGVRLVFLGVPELVVRDQDRFRHCEPKDAAELDWFIGDLAGWQSGMIVVDSLGEVMPMLGLSSNSPDEYTAGNRRVLTPLAVGDTVVVAIDHMPKDEGAREKGQTGTLAKKRAVNGVTLRVTAKDQFTPGRGGSAILTVSKDRPGGLREHCSRSGRTAVAGTFIMHDHGDRKLTWRITSPLQEVVPDVVRLVPVTDLAALDSLDPPPRSKRDVQDRLSWGSNRAHSTLKVWREQQKHDPV